jgi:hypothetical protein
MKPKPGSPSVLLVLLIVVETKCGKKGKPTITLSTEQSLAQPIFHLDIVDDPVAYVDIVNRASIRSSGATTFNDDFVAAVKAHAEGTGSEWRVVNGVLQYYGYNNYQGELMADYSPQQKYDLNISGAGDKTSYFISLYNRSIRLDKAKELLRTTDLNISEVAV